MTALSRRNFLGWAAASGLGGLMGCAGKKRRNSRTAANSRVLVLGGGFGGATAAKFLRLLDPTVKVTLIDRSKYYFACPGSNQVVAGLDRRKNLKHDYKALIQAYGVEVVIGEAIGVDAPHRIVALQDGSRIPYDRLILAPGIDFRWDAIEGYDEKASLKIPHAWRAGSQTTLLRRQLWTIRNGGVVIITVPENPYRCPPGPYERASLIAHVFKEIKPRSKILVIDAKTRFAKQSLFQQGWRELYGNMIEWVSSEKEGQIDRIDADRRIVHTEFGRHRADVLNVIPPQKAGKLAQTAGLTDSSGWCPVDPRTFESTLAPGVHVIGDAAIVTPMPKSAFAANCQAKVCAAAILDLLTGNEPGSPVFINNCYSFLNPDYAISVSGVYKYSRGERELAAVATGESPLNADHAKEAEHARSWYGYIMNEVFR